MLHHRTDLKLILFITYKLPRYNDNQTYWKKKQNEIYQTFFSFQYIIKVNVNIHQKIKSKFGL